MKTFSPLLIGEQTATERNLNTATTRRPFQSPPHRGTNCNFTKANRAMEMILSFQSPPHRGTNCNCAAWCENLHTSIAPWQSGIRDRADCN